MRSLDGQIRAPATALAAASRSRTANRSAASLAPSATVGRLGAEMIAERGRRHHLDFAARRLDRDAGRGRQQIALAGEGGQKDMMVARIVGDQHDAGDGRRAVLGWFWNAGFQKFSG